MNLIVMSKTQIARTQKGAQEFKVKTSEEQVARRKAVPKSTVIYGPP